MGALHGERGRLSGRRARHYLEDSVVQGDYAQQAEVAVRVDEDPVRDEKVEVPVGVDRVRDENVANDDYLQVVRSPSPRCTRGFPGTKSFQSN